MERTARILALFAKFWFLHPELRFFQMITYLESEVAKIQGQAGNDLFYLEDDQTEQALREILNYKGAV